MPKLNIDRVLDAAKTLRIQGLVEYQKDPEEEDIFPTHQQRRQIAMQTASWHQLLYHHHENVKDSSRSPWSRSEEGKNLKAYSNQDMDEALLALRSQSLSLTRASENFRYFRTLQSSFFYHTSKDSSFSVFQQRLFGNERTNWGFQLQRKKM